MLCERLDVIPAVLLVLKMFDELIGQIAIWLIDDAADLQSWALRWISNDA